MDREVGAIFHRASQEHHLACGARSSLTATPTSTYVAAGNEASMSMSLPLSLSLSQENLHAVNAKGRGVLLCQGLGGGGCELGNRKEDERPAMATRAAGIRAQGRGDRSKEAPRNNNVVEMFVWVWYTFQGSSQAPNLQAK